VSKEEKFVAFSEIVLWVSVAPVARWRIAVGAERRVDGGKDKPRNIFVRGR
jgi:hypothetical protein